jgi:surfeit locus 1 family protein
VHVLTPFRLAGGGHLLVNRGWLPMPADRRSLPGFETDAAERTIRGVLRQPPAGGPRLGEADDLRADQWPQLVTYLDPDRIAEVMGLDLPPRILHLDAADSSGFAGREWQAAVMRPAVHGAYALQWFALAAAALVIWIVLGVRRGRHLARPAGRAAQGSGVYF